MRYSIPVLANSGQSLQSLELSTSRVDQWRGDVNALSLVELLSTLPELLEFALDCPTGNIYLTSDAGVLVHPAPLDLHDLVC
jgi:hypothetical protein